MWTADLHGYNSAQTLVAVLKRCGDDLTRESVMKQAASLNTTLPMLLRGVKLSMPPTDLRPMNKPGCSDLTASDGGCSAMWSM